MRALLRVAPLLLLSTALHAQALRPADFSWRATLDTAGHHGLMRLAIPAEALAQMQTRNAADLRVFDVDGQPVAFSLATPATAADPPRRRTAAVRALPLHAADTGTRLPQGAVQLKVDGPGQAVWVQLGAERAEAAIDAKARRLPAALFDTRRLQDPITGLAVQARLPANVPVQLTLSTSRDLAAWSAVPTAGRIYRFDGDGAPANDIVELSAPLSLAGQYLRVEWHGQQGVQVDALAGLLPSARPARLLPAMALQEPHADGDAAIEWQLASALPVAQLEIRTDRAGTLLPLRILGRNQPSESWRMLGNTVVYRLDAAGQESLNPPTGLPAPAVRSLRVEATHGMRLDGAGLSARVLFDPIDIVFVAGGSGTYRLAVGRPATSAVALPLRVLAATTATPVDDLPAARIARVESSVDAARPAWARWLPRYVEPRTAGLWAVLLVGVLLLGGVAWSLLRQLAAKRS